MVRMKAPVLCCFLGVSSGLQAAGRVDSSPVFDCPPDTALGQSKSSSPLYCLWASLSPLTVLRDTAARGLKSPPGASTCSQLFSVCAPRLARPLLSCHPSCPDAPRCPLVAIQLFHFSLPLPPPHHSPPPPPPLLNHSGCAVYMIAGETQARGVLASSISPPPPPLAPSFYTSLVPDGFCDVSPLRIVSHGRIRRVDPPRARRRSDS